MYGLTFIEKGGNCFMASEIVGWCSLNSAKGTWQDPSLGIIKRIRAKHTIKCQPPKEYIIFLKELFKKKWFVYFIYQYIYIVVTSIKYKINNIIKSKDN